MQIEANMQCRGTVFVLSAPSGTGKDTVIGRALQNMPHVRRCVTATTRSPRPGEVDAVHYFFRTAPQFREMIARDELLEWAEVHGNFYGTPRWWVDEQVEQGIDVVLVIDVQGARQVRERREGTVSIFLAPPSLAELERRVRARGCDDEATIALRLRNAETELRSLPEYDYLVINDDLDRAVAEVRAILAAERLRLRPDAPVNAIVCAILGREPGGPCERLPAS